VKSYTKNVSYGQNGLRALAHAPVYTDVNRARGVETVKCTGTPVNAHVICVFVTRPRTAVSTPARGGGTRFRTMVHDSVVYGTRRFGRVIIIVVTLFARSETYKCRPYRVDRVPAKGAERFVCIPKTNARTCWASGIANRIIARRRERAI